MRIVVAQLPEAKTDELVERLEQLEHQVTVADCSSPLAAQLAPRRQAAIVVSSQTVELAREVIAELRASNYADSALLLVLPQAAASDGAALLECAADELLFHPFDITDLDLRLRAAVRHGQHRAAAASAAERMEAARAELNERSEQLNEAMEVMACANHRFTELFAGMPIACFTYDAEGKIHEWNRACEELFGRSAASVFQRTIWEAIGSDENAGHSRDVTRRVFEGERFEGLEWQRQTPSGHSIHMLCNTFPLHSMDGSIVGAISANIDITERKNAEDLLREERDFTATVLDIAGALVVVLDCAGRIVRFNRACEETTKYSFAEVCGRKFWEIFLEEEDVQPAQSAFQTIVSGEFPNAYENHWTTRSGDQRLISWSNTALVDADGTVKFVIGTGIDITERRAAEKRAVEYSAELERQKSELEQINRRLEALAVTDGLTGVRNHRSFQEFLEQEFTRSVRYDLPLSILLLDVDKFKTFNDSFGHPAGDEVLRRVARVLQNAARRVDLVARYGGEEFAVVLPNTTAEGAVQVAERLRQGIEQEPWVQRQVTASFGVASLGPDTPTRAALVAQADAALYASKAGGRNRVTLYSPEEIETRAAA